MALKFWGSLVAFGFVVAAVIWLPTTLSDSGDETSASKIVLGEETLQSRPVVVVPLEPQPGKEPISLSMTTPTPAPALITPTRRNLNLVFKDQVMDPLEQRQFVSKALLGGGILGEEYEEVGRRLRELNRTPDASLLPALETWTYTVRSGDSLWDLCNKIFPKLFDKKGLEVGLINMVNGMALNNDVIHPGQILKVPKKPLTLQVDKSEHGLTAYLGSLAVGAYRVGLGKKGRSTPDGVFTVVERQEDPTYYFNGRAIPFGDPANELGTRWLGFQDSPGKTGYGIHGTFKPATVGEDVSRGCIRMKNEEVEELFMMVARGTVVNVSD